MTENIQKPYSVGDLVVIKEEKGSRVAWEVIGVESRDFYDYGEREVVIEYDLKHVVIDIVLNRVPHEDVILVCKREYVVEFLEYVDELGRVPDSPLDYTKALNAPVEIGGSLEGNKSTDEWLDILGDLLSRKNLVGYSPDDLKEIENKIEKVNSMLLLGSEKDV